MTPFRVLIITEQSDRAEAALIAGIAADPRFEVMLVHAPHSAAEQFESTFEPLPRWSRRPLHTRGRWDLRASSEIRSLLSSFQPHLSHTFTSRTLSALTLAGAMQRVRGLPCPLRVGYRGTAGNLSKLNPADWVTYLNPTLSGIMCVSEAVRSSLISFGLPPHKLFTVHKGHDVRWYRSTRSRAEVRSSLRIPEQALVIGTNANMRPVKGVDLLLQAAKSLPLDGSVHYLLVGEIRDPAVKALATTAGLSHVVHCPGYRTDANELMHACDIFALPSRAREGLPKAMIEAMSGGVPVVASKVGGIPEVVRHGVEGLLAEPEDVPQLAHCLTQLIQDPSLRSRMGTAAKMRIEEHFTVPHSVNKLTQMYMTLLTGTA